MGFQSQVNEQPAPAEPGDFAGANPRMSVLAGPNGFKAGTDPLVVGGFAWANPTTGIAESNSANGGILGFVHRENQTVITAFLGEQRMVVQAGFPVTLQAQGDFWASFPDGIEAGEPVYANNTTGAAQADASGATLTRFVAASRVPVPLETAATATIAAQTGILTIAGANVAGVVEPGLVLDWAGKTANTYAKVTGQLTGTPGGIGTYSTTYTNRPAVTATTIDGIGGTMAKISTWAQVNP